MPVLCVYDRRSALVYLMDWMVDYVREVAAKAAAAVAAAASPSHGRITGPAFLDPQAGYVAPANHRAFYSICQATMYTVCFHAASLHLKEGGVEFLTSLPWMVILDSPLHPLSQCLTVSR